ncbi:zinc finger protein OZF-like isoform X2 [Euwallacea fornicatus]|uniref:zinc finger protein OZF-like isoform X2 n=1 Tax=Euwallacea fornicatus TaxID=995702 RepID=UPI00338D6505
MATNPEEPPILSLPEVISINAICRLCANQSDKLIGIYTDDGVQNALAEKLNLYLPIKVAENDHLPLQCCWQCASTLLAWHDLVITSVEADRRLRSYQFVVGEEVSKTYEDTETALVVGNDESLQSTEDLSTNLTLQPVPVERLPAKTCYQYDKNYTHTLKTHLRVTDSQKVRRRISEIVGKAFQCNICDKAYTKKHDLKRHLEGKHNQKLSTNFKTQNTAILAQCREENSKTFKCDFCLKIFNKSSNFLRHRSMHTNIKAFCCNLCGKNFRLNMSLTRHISEVHEGVRKFKCDVCEKQFKNKWSLDEHSNIHLDRRPYVCDVCGKAFKQKASLYIHTQYHSNQHSFECNICHQKFHRKHNVKLHILSHTQQKRFNCESCGAQFGTKRGWSRHCGKCQKKP